MLFTTFNRFEWAGGGHGKVAMIEAIKRAIDDWERRVKEVGAEIRAQSEEGCNCQEEGFLGNGHCKRCGEPGDGH